jgi:hypothetical protein
MTVSAAPGSSERAKRFAPVAAAGAPVGAIEGASLGRLIRRIDAGPRDVGGTGLLLVVGLLLGLILISAGCGPPS